MPVVPGNFRAGAHFQPLDDLRSVSKMDVATAAATRVQDGTWVLATGAKAGGVVTGAKGALVCMSDFDPNDVVGHPDASRLGQLTLLVGQHRGRTVYWQRAAGGANTPAPGAYAHVNQASGATTVPAIVALAGADATTVLATDGVLETTGAGVAAANAVALILTAPDANGFVEYITL